MKQARAIDDVPFIEVDWLPVPEAQRRIDYDLPDGDRQDLCRRILAACGRGEVSLKQLAAWYRDLGVEHVPLQAFL